MSVRLSTRGLGQAAGLSATAGQRPLAAVILDLDGVLVDSLPVMREAFLVAYAEVVGDGQAPFDDYCQHLGRYFPDICEIMGLPLAMEAPFVRESYRLAHRVPLYPGIRELLQALADLDLRLAVATGKTGARARSLLAGLGVLPLFEQVTGSDEVNRPKPAPDIVLRTLDVLGVEPGEAMMIGDAVIDLVSAQSAGVAAVAALWGQTDERALLAARPDAVLREPAEVLALCVPV
jgi:AHBA synthesis associated protein